MLTLPWSLDGPRAVDGGVFARRRSLAKAHLSAMDGGDQTAEVTFARNSLCPFPVVAGPQKGRPVGGGVAGSGGGTVCVYVCRAGGGAVDTYTLSAPSQGRHDAHDSRFAHWPITVSNPASAVLEHCLPKTIPSPSSAPAPSLPLPTALSHLSRANSCPSPIADRSRSVCQCV